MSPDLERIVHAIDQLRASLGGWDPVAFLSTLIATLAGAAVGLLPVAIERRAAYRTRLDESLAKVIQAAHRAADEAEEWTRQVGNEEQALIDRRISSPDAWDSIGLTLATPREGDLRAALQVALLTSRRGDRAVVQDVLHAFEAASKQPRYKRAEAFKRRSTFITEWRTNTLTPDQRRLRLKSMQWVDDDQHS
ncbi:hypothetical protein Csp2054_09030 [Curtobacterium sp. 'Ferrero']|uniref:hypothetical protein n=1 Tax=Curtobacterium sp. 'Ferrero' TaxID=2033654 RepID=UPI000BC99079|nr:hypothetical protein [Curtobacterium sp. 'Ferrero']PCN48006.1 hypothetical protein Csp2054_09030 [Curtobacterium sp. 'Ferrero']